VSLFGEIDLQGWLFFDVEVGIVLSDGLGHRINNIDRYSAIFGWQVAM
jgi:hypothetical protein